MLFTAWGTTTLRWEMIGTLFYKCLYSFILLDAPVLMGSGTWRLLMFSDFSFSHFSSINFPASSLEGMSSEDIGFTFKQALNAPS